MRVLMAEIWKPGVQSVRRGHGIVKIYFRSNTRWWTAPELQTIESQ